MEKKRISGKVIGAVGAIVVVACVAVIFLVMHFTKEESYRSIQIYELKGTTTIDREGIGEIEAIENLYLESGDRIIVADDSSARLKLDDDKYILVEENSILSILADGTKDNSKTTIQLEQGAITNEIQNALSENSSYDVTTPNSVMAVRGTIFRVEVFFDEKGEVYTKVSTYEGTVGSSLILPDGTRQEEILLVVGGKEVIIHMDENLTEYLMEPQDIDYSQIPVEVLEFLQEIVENGTDLPGITLTEIEQLLEELSSEEVDSETETETEIDEESAEENAEETVEETGGETAEETDEETAEEPDEIQGELVETASEASDNSGNAETLTSQNQEANNYTVTFTYNGTVFGTQTVREGEQAAVPRLAPAESGAWDFDFSTRITDDVTISWR